MMVVRKEVKGLVERAVASDLCLDTIKDKWNRGSALTSVCPRRGTMLLETATGKVLERQTNCNSWRCVSCRVRNRSRFQAIVTKGCSTLGRCSFITITYRAVSQRKQDASYVQRDWKEFWRRVRRIPSLKNLEHLRVMELTKKGVPHFHLIVGPVPQEMRIKCWRGSDFVIGTYRARMDDCMCLSHICGRLWLAITGDSYIAYAIPVTSAKGAGSYLAKYMMKGGDVAEREALGMKRRWSTSRGWPSDKRMRLLSEGGWSRLLWSEGSPPHDLEEKWDKVGTSGTAEQKKEKRLAGVRRFVKMIEGSKSNDPD